MGNFFDYDNGDMALDMDSGEIHMTSSWLSEDEN